LIGGNGSDLLFGDLGNDSLDGGEGNDTLTGAGLIANSFGRGEIDLLTGGIGSDRFVIGDANTAYYLTDGDLNYALITDFNPLEDTIQLKAGFTLASTASGLPSGTAIAQGGDLIAILAGVAASSLNSTAAYFALV
jgi:Ca2+-binding RTX toxin-like protein